MATAVNSPTPTPTATQCGLSWYVVPSDNASFDDSLTSVAPLSSNDAWAVGSTDLGAKYYNTLIEHWDGTAWSIVPSPNPYQADINVLTSVSAISSSDVWAVGYYHTGLPASLALTEHWDGNQWTIVQTASPSTYYTFSAVAALSHNDVWAVGSCGCGSNSTLIEHWDGSQWSVVQSPNSGAGSALNSISAVSSNNIWAVGLTGIGATLTEHWDGSQWSIVPSPMPNGWSSNLLDVAARATNDVWAVGTNGTNPSYPLIIHWDGTTWTVVDSPAQVTLYGVAALSGSDAWIVGNSGLSNLVLHWDGTSWSQVSSPNVGAFQNILHGVAAISASDVLAVGQYFTGNNYPPSQTLAQRYFDPCASTPTATASPSPTAPATTTTATATVSARASSTGTQLPATHTSIPTTTATNSPTAIPSATACDLQFIDVPQGSTFYPYVRCLACLGIINGYADGTFKPNNNVTRGQLSKIVSNAAGFTDLQPSRTFQDVPVGSTFQVFIGRLASRGFINGYACGGPGEQCVPPANLPYFRPNNNATRGQISKIEL